MQKSKGVQGSSVWPHPSAGSLLSHRLEANLPEIRSGTVPLGHLLEGHAHAKQGGLRKSFANQLNAQRQAG